MSLYDEPNYYDLLEVSPDATPQELRNSYQRVKSAYRKGSVALYSLMSEEETDELLKRIEDAYTILSHPDKRKDYDRSHGILSLNEQISPLYKPRITQNIISPKSTSKVVSIDRVPPMDTEILDTDLLVPPSTDIQHTDLETVNKPPLAPLKAHSPAKEASQEIAIQQEITQETEWRGSFIRKIREHRKVPLEELSSYTKISKTYLTAIEDEIYTKLPAAVFLRGFLIQIAKYLKLPHDTLATAYIARYNQGKSQKN